MNYSLRTYFVVSTICIFGILVTGFIMWKSVNRIYFEKYAEQNVTILKQIGRETDARISNLLEQIGYVETSNVFNRIKNKRKSDSASLFAEAGEMLGAQAQVNEMVDTIYYYRMDGMLFYDYNSKQLNNKFDIKNEPWYDKVFESYPYMLWYPQHTEKLFNDEKEVLSVVKVIYDRTETVPYGIICYNLDKEYFNKRFADIIKGGNGTCFIADADGQLMLSDKKTNPEIFIPNDDYGYRETGSAVTAYCTLNTNNWRIFFNTDTGEAAQSGKVFYTVFIIAIIIGILLSLALILIYVRWYISPIYEFEGIMNSVRKGNIYIRWTPKNTTKEIQSMADGFNSMADSIRELIERVDEGNRINTQLNARVIEEQLNAHFLYNVLNSIYYMAESGDHEKTAMMTEALANYVRHSLNRGRSITTVETEKEHIENYIKLEKFRYGDKFEFYEDFDSDVLAEKIPKLILQPIVENSIVHGLFERSEGGIIKVSAHKLGEYLEICVYDNGCGISEDMLEELNSGEEQSGTNVSNGIALRLLRKRISMNYSDFGFEIKSKENEYTLVKIKLNLKSKKFGI